jgi:hypothetical protein
MLTNLSNCIREERDHKTGLTQTSIEAVVGMFSTMKDVYGVRVASIHGVAPF